MLFASQESLIEALRELSAIVNATGKLSPAAFEARLAAFGKALNQFDRIDQVEESVRGTNTMFYVFDRMIEVYGGTPAMRLASLELESQVNGKPVTKMFVA